MKKTKKEEKKNQKNKIVCVTVKKNKNEKVMKSDPVVKVEPGLKPSPNLELKLDIPDDDNEEAKEEENEDDNLDGEGGYPDDKDESLEGEYYEQEIFYVDDKSQEDENVVAGLHRSIRDVPTEEFLTFEKFVLKNDDVGYLSMCAEFFCCDVCSKHQKKEESKGAHVDYCKQSIKYKAFLNVLMAKVEPLDFPSLLEYMVLRYAGRGEPFISPPHHPDMRSNAPSPSDLDDATYIEEEEDDFEKKPPAKNKMYQKERQKSGSKNEEKSDDKIV